MDEEREKRRKEKQDQNTNSILREIQQVGQLREESREKSKKRIFLDQSVVNGMTIWKSGKNNSRNIIKNNYNNDNNK